MFVRSRCRCHGFAVQSALKTVNSDKKMELIKKIFYKISKDDLGFFAGAFSYFMFFSTAALTLFLFLLFGEQVSFSVLKYLSPDYEALLKPVITSLTISARWSWFLLIPLAWGSTNVFASLEHAATVIAKRERRSTVTIRLLSFAFILILAFSVWGYTVVGLFLEHLPSWIYNLLFYAVLFSGFNVFLDGHVNTKYALVVGTGQSVIWYVVSKIVNFYIKQVSTSIVFKVASAIPVVLFWYYVLAYVILLGWELLSLIGSSQNKNSSAAHDDKS